MALVEIRSETAGGVWKIDVKIGDQVEEGQTLMILESMKMEIPILSTEHGTVKEIKVKPDDIIQEDDVVIVLER